MNEWLDRWKEGRMVGWLDDWMADLMAAAVTRTAARIDKLSELRRA